MTASARILAIALLCSIGVAAMAAQHAPARTHVTKPQSKAPLTLEQAVARVQNQTGGKVLKADSRNFGRIVEYRIKVLTPKGHVRVVTLRSDQRVTESN
ncbi:MULTISPECIES: PepSY domain-containing protein [Oleiagrimonas]|uniref:PepSY domain-containing protein n=1 Tax=Oleiagrimonas citrea TaxID=1665687 RepID=A0A846ZLA2_9GAMM|nr:MULTISPECIES: PepSY domain-containing protein [Oleiagrimonas]NKZ38369.1 hypothetical protein [Oleiagrimonas citrea]RAP58364.1 hypothetical protein BTJ49_05290 [Oleiagrimonas sp. MCCC 1A03011]